MKTVDEMNFGELVAGGVLVLVLNLGTILGLAAMAVHLPGVLAGLLVLFFAVLLCVEMTPTKKKGQK